MFYEFKHLGSPDYLKIERGTDFSFPAHLHQCFEIIVIRSGEMTVTVDERTFVLGAGEALLTFPNQIHALSSAESSHFLCIFSPRLVQAYASKVSNKLPQNNKFRPDAYLVAALERLEVASSSVERKGVLYSLCAQFDRTAVYDQKPFKNETLLYRIFSFVEEHFGGDCSLSALSKKTGYDYAYLSRYFKRCTGLSFNAYVTQFRLSHACYLLENTSDAVLQCALDSGFVSLRNFNRCFKAYLGLTPTQYLRQSKTG